MNGSKSILHEKPFSFVSPAQCEAFQTSSFIICVLLSSCLHTNSAARNLFRFFLLWKFNFTPPGRKRVSWKTDEHFIIEILCGIGGHRQNCDKSHCEASESLTQSALNSSSNCFPHWARYIFLIGIFPQNFSSTSAGFMLTQFSGAAEKFYWLNFPICVFAAYEKETKTGLQKKPNFKNSWSWNPLGDVVCG